MQGIPPPILSFIAEKIDTVAELEALLILCQERDRTWTEQDIAARLYTQPAESRRVLEALTRRQLTVAVENPPGFRFNSQNGEICQIVAEVERAYRSNLVAISRYIHSKAPASVKEFARAFDLKKDQ